MIHLGAICQSSLDSTCGECTLSKTDLQTSFFTVHHFFELKQNKHTSPFCHAVATKVGLFTFPLFQYDLNYPFERCQVPHSQCSLWENL
jgi:hypothetical protein